MNTPSLFHKSQSREFFAHHMLLHAAELQVAEAENSPVGRFNKCLAAMIMTALAVEALANAVGSRVVVDWPTFERMRPWEKLGVLVTELAIARDDTKEPWTTLRYLVKFRNGIAHAKPELIEEEQFLPEVALARKAFDKPISSMEQEITVGNARRTHSAVHSLKGILTDALPVEKRFGIYCDAWSGSEGLPARGLS